VKEAGSGPCGRRTGKSRRLLHAAAPLVKAPCPRTQGNRMK
jgi:hypothetical protein